MKALTKLAPSVLFIALIAACGEGSTGPVTPAPRADLWSAPSADSGVAPDSFLPPPAPLDGQAAPQLDGGQSSSCPELSGNWSGTLKGSIVMLLPVQVTGTLSMTLTPTGQPGSYLIQNGQMVAKPVGITGADATGNITGQVTCGVMDIVNEVEFYGVKTVGKVQGTFDASGQSGAGTWNGQSKDGKASGSGTYTLKRK